MYDFLFVIIELFSLALTAEMLQAEICRRERVLKGVGHFDRPFFRWKGTSPTNHCWVAEKTRRIALSYGIKISPVGSLD